MRYHVNERTDRVEMRVTETGDRTPQLLASMQECQDGRCECPTDQYDLLEAMDVQVGDDDITVTLRPRPGQRLDVGELKTCLHYTVTKAETP